MSKANFIAVDLGASGGRVLLGRFDGERFDLEELHRFPNSPVTVLDSLYWDVLQLWDDIKTGLRRYAEVEAAPLMGISVDTWGVDFALLDASGSLLGNPQHYRDPRTDGVMEQVFAKLSKARLYKRTGIQFMQINTLYQLYSLRLKSDPCLDCAETLLMMPDLFHYWLSGRKAGEYTIASTSQLVDARRRSWDRDLLETLSLPVHIFPDLVQPGTVIGPLLKSVADEVGLTGEVPVIATGSHDTASAVAAIPDLNENSVFISSGTWSLLGVETAEPVLNDKAQALDVTNEGGVGGTMRLLKNVAGLWLLQECRRQWQREGFEYTWDALLEHAARAEPFRSLVDPGAETFLNPGDMPAAIRAACRRTRTTRTGQCRESRTRCCLESSGAQVPLGFRRLGKFAGPPPGENLYRRRRQPKRSAQPVHRRRLSARRRRRAGRGDRARQPAGASCGDELSRRCGGGAARGRRIGYAAALRTPTRHGLGARLRTFSSLVCQRNVRLEPFQSF